MTVREMADAVAKQTKREVIDRSAGEGFDVGDAAFSVYWNYRRESWEVTMRDGSWTSPAKYVCISGESDSVLCCLCALVESFWS